MDGKATNSEPEARPIESSNSEPRWWNSVLRSDSDGELRSARGSVSRSEAVNSSNTDDATQTVHYTGVYIISVAARLADMHPQTLRKYERFGLLRPSRTAGSLRLYSEDDLIRLRLIRNLIERFDLNLAGVRLVMDIVFRLSRALAEIEVNETLMQSHTGCVVSREIRDMLESLAG